MYAIAAYVTSDGRVRDVPTFYLHEDVQGIVDEAHAAKIAREIIDPFGTLTVVVTAVRVRIPDDGDMNDWDLAVLHDIENDDAGHHHAWVYGRGRSIYSGVR